MNKILLILIAIILSGCVVSEPYYPEHYRYGLMKYCDDSGCRDIYQYYYYDNIGSIYYWDPSLGIWAGSTGYWRGRAFYPGYHPKYIGPRYNYSPRYNHRHYRGR
jgi:hypothetical protein